jgi:hypothetical protein
LARAPSLTIAWDGGTVLTAGQVLDAPPGSDLENTIGPTNLSPLAGPALDSAQQGSAGAVTN